MIYLNQQLITPTIFPDKTSQVWQLDLLDINSIVNCITWDFENESEFMHVAQIVTLLRAVSSARITLQMDYFPYARQDKEVSNTTTYALRTFCSLLETLRLDDITTVDLHSNVALDMLFNLTNSLPVTRIYSLIDELNPDYIVFPDKGAEKRYSSIIDRPTITLEKSRDQLTGDLTMQMAGNTINLLDKKLLIIDDLCDGGGTFLLAADLLLEADADILYLYTTHGIYSKGTEILKNKFTRVFNYKGEI